MINLDQIWDDIMLLDHGESVSYAAPSIEEGKRIAKKISLYKYRACKELGDLLSPFRLLFTYEKDKLSIKVEYIAASKPLPLQRLG